MFLGGQFVTVLKFFLKDKILIPLSLAPIIIGMALYFYAGTWIFGDLLNWGESFIAAKIGADSWGNIIKGALIIILTVLFYFLLTWTFLLIISIIASPFNDVISKRVEKIILENENISSVPFFPWLGFTILNESKKVLFIVVISAITFLLSFIPMLFPLTLFISGLLIAYQFLDYSWSRHDMPFRECLKDMKSHIFKYGITGIIFFFIIAVPIVNLFMLPYAVVFYTYLFSESRKKQITNQSV